MGENLPEEVAKVLFEYSPRIIIDVPTLIPFQASQTGWLVLEPQTGELWASKDGGVDALVIDGHISRLSNISAPKSGAGDAGKNDQST